GKSTMPAPAPRQYPAVRNRVPAPSERLSSNRAAPAVGRTREEILRGRTGNTKPAAWAKRGSTVSARARRAGSVVRSKVVSAAATAALGRIASAVAVDSVDCAAGDRRFAVCGNLGEEGLGL